MKQAGPWHVGTSTRGRVSLEPYAYFVLLYMRWILVRSSLKNGPALSCKNKNLFGGS